MSVVESDITDNGSFLVGVAGSGEDEAGMASALSRSYADCISLASS